MTVGEFPYDQLGPPSQNRLRLARERLNGINYEGQRYVYADTPIPINIVYKEALEAIIDELLKE